MLHILTLKDVRDVYDDLVDLQSAGEFETPMGAWVRGTTDRWSAILHSLHPVFGVDAYPTLEQKASRLLVGGCVLAHPLVDGNKRLAIFVMHEQLLVNGYSIDASDAELIHSVHAAIEARVAGADPDRITRIVARWIEPRVAPV